MGTSTQPSNSSMQILIAEDSPTQAQRLRHILEQKGYEVSVAANGRLALDAARQRKPTLIISDVVMPEMDGYGLCKAIKSDEKLTDIPVMLVTTLSDPQDVIRGLECGADNFIRKPYNEDHLLSRIGYVLMNTELRKTQKMQIGVEINLGGQKLFINSERQQILDLLISTYEQAVEINSELKLREKDLVHSNQVLKALCRIADGLNHAGSEQEVAELALERALELPGIQAGWVFLREGESGFRLAAARNLPPALKAAGAMEGACACCRRLISGELDSVTNILECERLGKATGNTRGLCYHASVPLWLGDRTLGVMNLVGPEKGLFNEDELKVLHSVGNQVAVALERAHLHENLERLVQERTAALEAEIVERKRIEKEQARLVAIFEATPDMVATGSPEGKALYCNPAGQRMLGFETGQDISEININTMYPDRVATLIREQAIPHAIEHGAWSGETAFLQRDGREIPVSQVIIAHKGGDGSVEYLSTTARDITEQKRAEELLQQLNVDLEQRVAARSADAEQANRAKSAFLATMSHEIRTPMNGVLGMIELLSLTTLDAEQRSTLEIVRESGKSLLRIIDDILDFSKIEAGRLELERAPVALPDLIESVCDTMLPVAIDKGVELSLFISPQVPAQVWSDATRLRQVLFNLAGNAIKFSASGPERRGRVSIRVDIAAGETPHLVLRIADNGIGMAPEMLPHLFSSFTQAEASTTRRFGGTGLGLAICKRLVTLMNGEIDVQSNLGEGSTFTVTLPVEVVDGSTLRTDPDVTGLDCIVVGSDVHADDLRVYLEHAGARVHPVADLDAAVLRATGLSRPVVIQNTRRDSSSTDALHAAFAATPGVRHLLIVRGQRRRTRMTAADVVTLDGNCLRRSSLLRAVAVAVGRASPEVLHEDGEENLTVERAPPTTVAEARAQGRLLLIAEDDEVNQKVILSQIQMLGYAAEITDNGVEALHLWRAGHYALLLTDLHMPEMDGYALAEAIRREEPQRSSAWQQRMPILALTANALRGEAVRAQAAGMDEYLTKPLQLRLLNAALKKWLPRDAWDTTPGTLPGELDEDSRSAPATSVLDIAVLVGLVGDDPQVARKFLADYRATKGHLASELRAARAADDIRQIGAIAHKLKSSSRSVGALVLGDLCAELENACRTGAREGISQGMMQFEAALLAVDAQIDHLLARR